MTSDAASGGPLQHVPQAVEDAAAFSFVPLPTTGWNDHQKKIVQSVLADATYLIAHQALEDYVSQRPYQRPTRAQVHAGRKFGNDCTGTVKMIVCDWNGIPVFDDEPSGYGDTATFFHGSKVYHVAGGPDHWQPLDLLLYKEHPGPFRAGPQEHCTMVTRRVQGVWNCFSMGGDADPVERPWNYRSDLAAVVRFPIPLKAA